MWEPTSHWYFPYTNYHYCRALMFSFLLARTSFWIDSRVDSSLRCHDAHVTSLWLASNTSGALVCADGHEWPINTADRLHNNAEDIVFWGCHGTTTYLLLIWHQTWKNYCNYFVFVFHPMAPGASRLVVISWLPSDNTLVTSVGDCSCGTTLCQT